MGQQVARARNGHETRAKIVRAAAEAIDRSGYTATSVTTLVESIGITKGAFYFHFPAKQDLAVAVVDAMHAGWAPAVQQWAASEADPVTVALGLLDELVLRASSDVVARAGIRLTVERELTDAGLLDPFPEWERMITHLLHRAQRGGLLREGISPATAAHVLVFGVLGEIIATGHTSDPDVLRSRTDVLLGLVVPACTVETWAEQWRLSGWAGRSLPLLSDPDRGAGCRRAG
ncbi:MAG: TetR/AcrR family transcriptional regulator [Mycobacteriaceae bacterium]